VLALHNPGQIPRSGLMVRATWRSSHDEKPLFPECHNYLACARDLVNEAHTISDRVHGNNHLTLPRET